MNIGTGKSEIFIRVDNAGDIHRTGAAVTRAGQYAVVILQIGCRVFAADENGVFVDVNRLGDGVGPAGAVHGMGD